MNLQHDVTCSIFDKKEDCRKCGCFSDCFPKTYELWLENLKKKYDEMDKIPYKTYPCGVIR